MLRIKRILAWPRMFSEYQMIYAINNMLSCRSHRKRGRPYIKKIWMFLESGPFINLLA
jgi:hypothetical protein